VLSAIGLALDLVGAVALVIGIFRPPRPTLTGWAYTPDDAARDAAFGLVGATLLGLGFIAQSLPYFGLTVSASATCIRVAAGIALASALLYGYIVYGVAYMVVLRRWMRSARERHADMTPQARWAPRGWRFWRHDFLKD
jgi:hypothetical protein